MMKMNGKGDKRRPMQISHEELAARWDAVFNGKPNANLLNLDYKEEKIKEEKKETKKE